MQAQSLLLEIDEELRRLSNALDALGLDDLA
jgi:hypothetical protein